MGRSMSRPSRVLSSSRACTSRGLPAVARWKVRPTPAARATADWAVISSPTPCSDRGPSRARRCGRRISPGVGGGVSGARVAGCGAHHEDGPEAAPVEQVDDGAQRGLVHEMGVVDGHHQGAFTVREPQQCLRRRVVRIAEFHVGPALGTPGRGSACRPPDERGPAERAVLHRCAAIAATGHRPGTLGRVCRALEYVCTRAARSHQEFVQKLGLPGTRTTRDYHEPAGSSSAFG